MMTEENGWKTEEYHGAKLMVRAQRRQKDNEALDGHGHEWDFSVIVADAQAQSSMADEGHAVKSDPNVFYSTQAIAEHMGFIRGREMVEHRASTSSNPTSSASTVMHDQNDKGL